MKKTFLTLVAVMAVMPVMAQIDTIELPTTPPRNYYPECTWMTDTPATTHLYVRKYAQTGIAVEAYEYALDSSLRVVGLAGILDTFWFSAYSYTPDSSNMAARVPEYLCLYQPGPDTMILKKMVCYTDKTPKCRIKLYSTIFDRDFQGWLYPPLYEVYFDDTVVVHDSICVGYTCNNNFDYPRPPIYPVKTGAFFLRWDKPEGGDSISQRILDINPQGLCPPRWLYSPKGLYFCSVFPIFDTTGMNADTTQGGDTTVVDTTVVDTTRISPVVDKFTHLFPNPATEYAVVCSSFPMRSVALYDPSGRCVMRRRVEGTTAQIEVTGYAAGVYYLEIRTPAGRTVKRLMIQ